MTNTDPFAVSDQGGDFAIAPSGMHPAVCIAIVDEGDQVNKTFNSSAKKVELGFEIQPQGEEPIVVYRQFTKSIGQRAALRAELESWRGKAFTDEELKSFSLSKVLGAQCQLNIVHSPSKDGSRTYANIKNILPKADAVVTPTNEQFMFTIEDPQLEHYDKLPKFIQNRVDEALRAKGVTPPSGEITHDNVAQNYAAAPVNQSAAAATVPTNSTVQALDF